MKNCDECNGEIKPHIDFYKQRGEEQFQKFKKSFEKKVGRPLEDDGSFNCLECGKMWGKNWKPMKMRLAWLQGKV